MQRTTFSFLVPANEVDMNRSIAVFIADIK